MGNTSGYRNKQLGTALTSWKLIQDNRQDLSQQLKMQILFYSLGSHVCEPLHLTEHQCAFPSLIAELSQFYSKST